MLPDAHKLASALAALRPDYTKTIAVHKLTPDGRSWLLHAERFWPADEAALREVWATRPAQPTRGMVMGREVDFPRRTAAYGVDYKYTGQVQRSEALDDAPAVARQATLALCSVAALSQHNALLVNWYEAKDKEYMGAHSDDERELVPLAPVVSLSWATRGHYRRFRFTARKGVVDALLPDAWGLGSGTMPLRNGCLVVMGGQCQATHKHELMKPTKALGETEGRRVNLTLRAFSSAADVASRKRRRDDEEDATAVAQAVAEGGLPPAKPTPVPTREQQTLSRFFEPRRDS